MLYQGKIWPTKKKREKKKAKVKRKLHFDDSLMLDSRSLIN